MGRGVLILRTNSFSVIEQWVVGSIVIWTLQDIFIKLRTTYLYLFVKKGNRLDWMEGGTPLREGGHSSLGGGGRELHLGSG